MTRDEAIEIEKKKLTKYGFVADAHTIAAANIDALIELGLLKVDKELDPHVKLEQIIMAYHVRSILTLDELGNVMKEAGIKVVKI